MEQICTQCSQIMMFAKNKPENNNADVVVKIALSF